MLHALGKPPRFKEFPDPTPVKKGCLYEQPFGRIDIFDVFNSFNAAYVRQIQLLISFL
jgi:hypothetical protein